MTSSCLEHWWLGTSYEIAACTVYHKKYAHGFVVLCFIVVMQSFIMNSHEVFIHIHQGCFAGTGAIVILPQCQWSKPDGYGKISQCITTTKHSKARTVCIFLGIYCIYPYFPVHTYLQWQLNLIAVELTAWMCNYIPNKGILIVHPLVWSGCGNGDGGGGGAIIWHISLNTLMPKFFFENYSFEVTQLMLSTSFENGFVSSSGITMLQWLKVT